MFSIIFVDGSSIVTITVAEIYLVRCIMMNVFYAMLILCYFVSWRIMTNILGVVNRSVFSWT